MWSVLSSTIFAGLSCLFALNFTVGNKRNLRTGWKQAACSTPSNSSDYSLLYKCVAVAAYLHI